VREREKGDLQKMEVVCSAEGRNVRLGYNADSKYKPCHVCYFIFRIRYLICHLSNLSLSCYTS